MPALLWEAWEAPPATQQSVRAVDPPARLIPGRTQTVSSGMALAVPAHGFNGRVRTTSP
jgi:hypothetical protein